MRAARLAFLLVAIASAGETPQVRWIGSWEAAFRQAAAAGRPVMICINSKDGERANETTAQTIYRDPAFVDLSRRFVMVLVSTREHAEEGVCPRFGRVSCRQHRECWKDLKASHGEQFVVPHTPGDMISPQHAWFRPDGTLLRRREYFLDKSGLIKRMKATLAEMKRGGKAGGPKDAPGGATLGAADRAELERFRSAGDRETRAAALGNLLGADKAAVRAALVELLETTKDDALKCALLRALAGARVPGVRPTAEKLLGDRDAGVRSCAAVALEELAHRESIPALLKRGKLERDAIARKNVYRALGACGGPAADKAAAKALLKAMGGDKQKMVCKHAALALLGYQAGAGAALVRRRLEQAVLRSKDKDVQRAIVWVLAHLGEVKTTVPVLTKVLGNAHEDWEQAFVRGAIGKLEGASGEEKFGESARWLYWEDRQDPARVG